MEINLGSRSFGYNMEVGFYDVDYTRKMRLSSLLRVFAKLAGEDYTDRGLSHTFLREHGYVFLVSKVAFKIYRLPEIGENVNVQTWVMGTKGAKFLRGYEMLSESGEKLAVGESVWICVSPEDRKIVRPKDFPWQTAFYDNGEVPVHCISIKPQELYPLGKTTVVRSQIDENGHLNTAVNGDIATDFLTKEEYEACVSELYLNYSHEAYLGEEIEIMRCNADSDITLAAKVGERPCFEFKIVTV